MTGAGKTGRLALDGGKRPRLRKADSRSWTRAKEQAFFDGLAESCNVKHAAARAGVSASSVYVRRGKDAAFRAGWDKALAIGYAQLEMTMLERALHGVEKIVKVPGGPTEMMRDYSDRLGLSLLRMHRDSAGMADEEHGPEDVAEAAERILARLKAIGARDKVEVKASPSERLALIRWGLRGGRA